MSWDNEFHDDEVRTVRDWRKHGKRKRQIRYVYLTEDPKIKKSFLNECSVEKTSPFDEHSLQTEIANQAQLLPALHANIGLSWYQQLKLEFTMPYFANLSKFLEERRRCCEVFPPPEDVWAWTQLPFQSVKVVILGVVPHNEPGQDHGLSFSVCTGIPKTPSLKNIFKELKNEYPKFEVPNHGNLIGWLRQGVLLLNITLTVEANRPMSHYAKGWESLTTAVIHEINWKLNNVVFLLWGVSAGQKVQMINRKKHLVLTAQHPSPYSAHRGFLGCRHFSQCNDYLIKNGKSKIDWTHLPDS